MSHVLQTKLAAFLSGANGAIGATFSDARQSSGLKPVSTENFTTWFNLPQYRVGQTCISQTSFSVLPKDDQDLVGISLDCDGEVTLLAVPTKAKEDALSVLERAGLANKISDQYDVTKETVPYRVFCLPADALEAFEQCLGVGVARKQA